jgi:transmembrane sensor
MSFMSASGERVRNQITEEAASWFVANREGLDAQERGMFAAWLKASPLHVEEYLAVSVITRDLRAACDASGGAVDDLLERARVEGEAGILRPWLRFSTTSTDGGSLRWPRVAVLMAVMAVLSVALVLWWNFRPAARETGGNSSAQRFEPGNGEQ